MKKYAYIRVSSKNTKYCKVSQGNEKYWNFRKDMFIDKQSGKDFFVNGSQLLLKKLESGNSMCKYNRWFGATL